jgi:hypothetical protein
MQMQVCKFCSLIASVALLLGAGVSYSAPQPAGISYYSAGLSAQLFSDMPTWPASADLAHTGIEAAARFVPKEATAAERADTDSRMAAAAMLRDPAAVDRDPRTPGVAAWEQLIASNDSVNPDNAKLDVLVKRMDDITESFQAQHEQHEMTFKQQVDLHMTSCAQVRQVVAEHTNVQYAIAQGENAALRGVYFQMQGVIRSILAREARWAVAYKGLSQPRQIANQGTMTDRQNETVTAIHLVSQLVGSRLESEIEPWVVAHDKLKEPSTCSS